MLSFLGKSPRKIFGKLITEPHFPKDAKIVEVTYKMEIAMYRIVVESQLYPDVVFPTGLLIVCHKDNFWNIPEKVQFD